MLASVPTSVHHLAEVHDGSNWRPWSELSLLISLQQEVLLVTPEILPKPGNMTRRLKESTPWWVEFRQGEEKVIRVTQSEMVRTRPTKEEDAQQTRARQSDGLEPLWGSPPNPLL